MLETWFIHIVQIRLFLERTFQSSSETVLALEMSRIVSIELASAPFPSVLSSKPRGMGHGAGSQVDSSQRKTCPAELTQQPWAAQLVPGKSLHNPWSSMPGKSAFVTQGHRPCQAVCAQMNACGPGPLCVSPTFFLGVGEAGD